MTHDHGASAGYYGNDKVKNGIKYKKL